MSPSITTADCRRSYMKKLLLGSLLALGISSNAMAIQSSFCIDRATLGDMKCGAIITLEIMFPPSALVGTTLGAEGFFTWRDLHKSEAVQAEFDLLNATGEVGGVLASVVGQIQVQTKELTGRDLSADEVLREIEFASFN